MESKLCMEEMELGGLVMIVNEVESLWLVTFQGHCCVQGEDL